MSVNCGLKTSSRRHGWYVIGPLLAAGVVLFAIDFDGGKWPEYLVAAAAGAAALIPAIRDRLARILGRMKAPSPRGKWVTFATFFFLSAWYFLLSAALAGRELFPKLHDEYMYLLQARMLSEGRLWMPRHELAPFFDSFHILVTPVYAATYFPGAALFYVPGMWMHVAPYYTSVVIAALAVAMLYLVMSELFDGVAGVLAALMAVALPQLRVLSVMIESHPAMLLLLLLAGWTYVRWRRTRRVAWAGAFGVFAGWAAITRPLDAVCLVGPFCVLVAWDVFRVRPAAPVSPGRRVATALGTLAAVAATAAPFLLLQFKFDKDVTGNYLQTPFGQYARTTFPGLEFGYGPRTPPADSPAALPQVRDYYREFFRSDLYQYGRGSFARTWVAERLAPVADVALPAHAFYALLPLGLLCLRRPPRAAFAAGALALPLAYAFYPSFLRHYGLVCAPAFVALAVGGIAVLRRSLPGAVSTALPLAVAALCVALLPELRGARDPFMQAPYLADINDKLARLDHLPAVVLFHYDTGRTDVHEEPVYNLDTAWPDDAPVIRAQDLGPENWRIFDYYARRQPQRYFYLYNRTTAELTPLGYATELARK